MRNSHLLSRTWYEIKSDLDNNYYHVFILDYLRGVFPQVIFYGGKVNSFIDGIVDLEFVVNDFDESILDIRTFEFARNVNHLYSSCLAEPHALDYIKIYA